MGHGWQWLVRGGWVLILLALYACRSEPPGTSDPAGLSRLSPPQVDLIDDFDRTSLQLALQQSLSYLRRLPPDRIVPLAGRQLTVLALQDTLETFAQVLDQTPTFDALHRALDTQFELVPAAGRNGQGDVLFTGYYEAVLSGSPVPTDQYTYPLYSRPDDLLNIDLAHFRPEWSGERLIARYDNGQVLPYFTRHEIDIQGKLRGRHLELVWLSDVVEGFFLHIQGSGRIHLTNGQSIRVNYAASNGHPYRSIGKLLLDEGRLSPNAISMQRLRDYLRTNRQDRHRVMTHNPRYIFFRQVNRG
ncbi:MAG: MltA domain-containing protein, partial [Candidatus Tectomicrobia bacterium]|nr:MltA domain-containing protein [Candidatus Tectomicrobia bacterium]